MKIKLEAKIVANLVGLDPLRIEHLRLQSSKINSLVLIFSSKPRVEQNCDAYVLPAHLIPGESDFYAVHAHGSVKRVSGAILYYGEASLLRRAFLAGGTDYLKEPWDLSELECRLLKLMQGQPEVYSFPWGELELKPLKIIASTAEVSLSFSEYRLCRILFQNFGQLVPREVLYYAIWGKSRDGSSRVVDVHISALRRKLKRLGTGAADCIASVRGRGYLVR